MKHFILLLILGLAAYVAWTAISPAERGQTGQLIRRHSTPILIMLAVLFAGLLVAFFFPSAKIL